MRPAMISHWKHSRHGSRCGAHAAWGASPPEARWGPPTAQEELHGGPGGGGFGVRRPLRFLAYKLGLTEPQVTELARILDELKTERAQAAVDDRRALSALAESVDGDAFDAAKAKSAAALRGQSTERLQAALVRAVERIHALLEPEQRSKLAYLIRTGALLL